MMFAWTARSKTARRHTRWPTGDSGHVGDGVMAAVGEAAEVGDGWPPVFETKQVLSGMEPARAPGGEGESAGDVCDSVPLGVIVHCASGLARLDWTRLD
jgi:hypothetical protein